MRNELVAACAALILAATASAQPTTPPAAPPADPPKAAPKPAPKQGGQSLDELLGLPKKAPATPGTKPPAPAAPATGDPKEGDAKEGNDALERKLTEAEAREAFEEAVRQMAETAGRLERAGDTGLTTQRLQEEIIRKLDALIKNQEDQDQQSSSSSSSSKSQQQGDPNAGQQPGKPQNKPGQQDQKSGTGDQAATPPAKQDAQFNNRLDAARAAWGALPERLRGVFTQGMDDYYSKLYQSMTEQYYRKTAENVGP